MAEIFENIKVCNDDCKIDKEIHEIISDLDTPAKDMIKHTYNLSIKSKLDEKGNLNCLKNDSLEYLKVSRTFDEIYEDTEKKLKKLMKDNRIPINKLINLNNSLKRK